MYTDMVSIVEPRKKGVAVVDHIELTESMILLSNIRALRDGLSFDVVQPGKYARLIVNGQLVMSDTQMERITNRPFMMRAHGDILIGGLGIGLILPGVLKKEDVRSVTVIEKERDVIDIIHPQHKHPKLKVVHGDVFTYEPERKFDVIYLDIWAKRDIDNLPEMAALKRRYRKWLNKENPSRWIGCWFEDYLKALKRRGW